MRLRAIERIALLVGEMVHQNSVKKSIGRREIRTIVVGTRLEESLPTTYKLSQLADDDGELRNDAQAEVDLVLKTEAELLTVLMLEHYALMRDG